MKTLNTQQTSAVEFSLNRHCLVLAGAGCGKTTVLAERAAYCVKNRMDPRSILALTFTRKAAMEMRDRLSPYPGCYYLNVNTFHGFARSCILCDSAKRKEVYKKLGYGNPPELLLESERKRILVSLTSREEREIAGPSAEELSRMVAVYENNPERIEGLEDKKRVSVLTAVARRYVKAKKDRDLWEFQDMIKSLLFLMERGEDISGDYRYILVDEFQDTSPVQIKVLKGFIARGAVLFAVGDDDQAIYRFRGGDTSAILNFRELFKGAEVIKLEKNYRSTSQVLKAANRVFRDKPQDYRKILCQGNQGLGKGGRVEKVFLEDENRLLEWSLSVLREIGLSEERAEEDAAFLFRMNSSADRFRKRLRERGVFSYSGTLHSSKGLEYKTVFICDLEEGFFPLYRRPKQVQWYHRILRVLNPDLDYIKGEALEEEKRLFYVGVTRAKKYLFLVSVSKRSNGLRSVRTEPSRFMRLL